MTNGEKIQKVFDCEVCEPIIEDDIIHVIFADKKDSAIGFDWSWWNMEYKEPTIRNCFGCKYSKDNHRACTEECHLCMWENQYTPTTKNDLGVERQIKEICISYPKSDLKEHDGQPYYSVKYIENGEGYEGYGTYKIEAFMEYLRNYFMPSVTPQFSSELENNSKKLAKDFGELDCISRADALALYCDKCGLYNCISKCASYRAVEKMPSVTPIKPKGHWIEEFNDVEGEVRFTCSNCRKYQLFGSDFCYHCGSYNGGDNIGNE